MYKEADPRFVYSGETLGITNMVKSEANKLHGTHIPIHHLCANKSGDVI